MPRGLTLGFPEIEDRSFEAYARAFKAPLLDHSSYRNVLQENFRPISYAQPAAEYPCIVLRTDLELDARTSVEGPIIVWSRAFTLGIACETIRDAAQHD